MQQSSKCVATGEAYGYQRRLKAFVLAIRENTACGVSGVRNRSKHKR